MKERLHLFWARPPPPDSTSPRCVLCTSHCVCPSQLLGRAAPQAGSPATPIRSLEEPSPLVILVLVPVHRVQGLPSTPSLPGPADPCLSCRSALLCLLPITWHCVESLGL